MKAIILKKQPTREYDLLVTCYTDQAGKLTATAKSALKPASTQGPHLDILNMVDFELVNGRATPIITAAQSQRTYGKLKNSLPAMAAASFFLEVMDKMVFEHQRDERLWDFLSGFLNDLDGGRISLREFRNRQSELLRILGYAAQEQPSAGLAAAGGAFFSFLDGRYEHLAGRRFDSLAFLYSVLK